MTVKNLIELFEKGLKEGTNFLANTSPIVGRYMEFSFSITSLSPSISSYSYLGVISILCEFDHKDYYENKLNIYPFGLSFYIKFDSRIPGIEPFKFPIKYEEFLKLLKLFRVFERDYSHMKKRDDISKFESHMETIEESYGIEVSSLKRKIITEKITIIDNEY